jgi:hypothetical protein
MLAHVLPNAREFRPMVHPDLTNKNHKASTYQYSDKDEEGLTLDTLRITKTIMYCDRDEGITT